ncbi:MAG: hypothetical protein LBH39_01460 [Clostridiales Family XIII bacterium]|jgi:hypothetical protein|nr:hypothetical protein [Clostridiales Family XIII bacterium]
MDTKNIGEMALAPDGYGTAALAYDEFDRESQENLVMVAGVPVSMGGESAAGAQVANDPAIVRVFDSEGREVRETRLLAAIAAAIAAFEEARPGCDVVVRKINRIAGPRIAWNTAGLREVIDSRRF